MRSQTAIASPKACPFFGGNPLRPGLLAVLLSACGLQAAPPTIKAKLDEPVLEELMGGCSLRCAFDWHAEVEAPGAPKRQAVNVFDDDSALTAWTTTAGKNGVGVKIHLLMPKKLRPEQRDIPVFGLDLINGNWKTEELWEATARVKKARLFYNGRPFQDLVFADSRRWQRIEFPDIFIKDGDYLTIEILEVFRGKEPGLAISEIVLQGAH